MSLSSMARSGLETTIILPGIRECSETDGTGSGGRIAGVVLDKLQHGLCSNEQSIQTWRRHRQGCVGVLVRLVVASGRWYLNGDPKALGVGLP